MFDIEESCRHDEMGALGRTLSDTHASHVLFVICCPSGSVSQGLSDM